MSLKEYKTAINEIINEYNLDIILLVGIIIFGIYIYIISPMLYVPITNGMIDGHNINVVSRSSGTLIESYILKDQEVQKGDLIMVIDPKDYQQELALIQTRIRKNEQKLLDLNNPQQKIINPVEELSKNTDNKKSIQNDTKNIEETKIKAIDIETGKEIPKENLIDPLLDSPSKIETKDEIQTEIKNLKIQEEEVKLRMSSTRIYAPQHGVIKQISVVKGDVVNASDVLCTMIPKQVWVLARVSPEKLDKIEIGQEAMIKVSGYKYRTFKGTVVDIDRTSKIYRPRAYEYVRSVSKDGETHVKPVVGYQIKIEFIEDYTEFNLPPKKEVLGKIEVKSLINKGY